MLIVGNLSQRVDTIKREMFSQKKRKAIRRWFVSIRHRRHVLSQCPKQKYFPPVLVPFFNISGGWLPLFRALAKNIAPMTNADKSPTNRLTLFPIYLSLFIVSTLCLSTANSSFPVASICFTGCVIYVFSHQRNTINLDAIFLNSRHRRSIFLWYAVF